MKDNSLKQRSRKAGGCGPRAILTLVGGVMVQLAIGAYYTFGNMAPYIISYLRVMSGEPSLVNVDSLWITNTGALPGPFALVIAGAMEKHLGCKFTMFVGLVVYSSGAALTYFTIQHSLALVCLSYGVWVQIGSFIAYGVSVQTVVRWFPKHPSLAIGVVLCGTGGSTLILNQVITEYINPENISPDLKTDDGEKYFTDKDVLSRVPKMFIILAGIYISLSCIGVALMSEPNDNVVIMEEDKPYSSIKHIDSNETTPILGANNNNTSDITFYDTEINAQGINNNEQRETVKSKKRQPIKTVLLTMLKNRNSYIVLCVMLFVFSGMNLNITLYKAYGQTFISDDKFLALVGSLAAIFNCSFRPIWGFVMDKYGFQVTTKLLAASCICLMTTVSLTEKLGKVAFMIWICASYASFCGIFPVGFSAIGKLFGVENMVVNMSFTFIAMVLGTLFGGFCGITLKSVIGWHGLFLLSGCLGVIGFISSFFFNGKDENGKEI